MRLSWVVIVRQNLTRKMARSVLLVFCIAVAFFVFVVLSSFRQGFDGMGGYSRRLAVAPKTGNNATLPIAYMSRIRALPGVADVTPITRLRAYVRVQRNIVGANAVDPASYARIFSDTYAFTGKEVRAFEATRDGALVGQALADRMGWRVGDRVTLTSFVYRNTSGNRNWTFTVEGIFGGAAPTVDTGFMLFRQDYFNDGLAQGRDRVNLFAVMPAPGANLQGLANRIDMLYANSSDETRTLTEGEFMEAILDQFADVAMIVRLVVGASFATILMIVANIMVFAVRERRLETGVLKVLGFSAGQVMRLVVAESLVLFLLGLTAALAMASIVMPFLAHALSSFVPGMEITPGIIVRAFGLALAFGVLTGLPSAIGAVRLPAASALKQR